MLQAAGEHAVNEVPLPEYGVYGHDGDEVAVDGMARRAGLPQDGEVGMDVLVLDYCRSWLSG